jgi:hypothetical protein
MPEMHTNPTPTPFTVALAQATDRRLADLHAEATRVDMKMEQAIDSIHYDVDDTRDHSNRFGRGEWRLSLADCLAKQPRHANIGHYAKAFADHKATLLDCRMQLVGLYAAIAVEDAVYRQHHWPRFFLCVSSDGHIHSSMGCSTCTYKTRFGWLPDLSGLDEAAAVAAHGAKLCTVCYPSAPVEWTNHFETAAAAKKATQCPGSGKHIGWASKDWNCPDCGKYGRPSKNGYVRTHKPAKEN